MDSKTHPKSQYSILHCVNRYASSVGAKHFSTSAKMNKGLDELFLDITKRKPESFMYGAVFRPSGFTVGKGLGQLMTLASLPHRSFIPVYSLVH